MNPQLEALTANWEKRPGASPTVIRERERALGVAFPAKVKAPFLGRHLRTLAQETFV
jgi:hypothetical protein